MATKFVSELTKRVEFSIEYALLEIGRMVTTDIRRSLMQRGTGRWYYSKRYKKYGEYNPEKNIKKWRSMFKSKESRRLFYSKKYGESYLRGYMHQASVPSKPPAPDTETLRQSIDFEVFQRGGGYKTLIFRSNAPYSRYLEFGTHKMHARPFMRPAIYRNMKKLGPEVAKAFRFQFGASVRTELNKTLLAGFKLR